jgi:predicted AlkP superfamily pyrophosphatase or phosphodiesterase
MTCWPKSEIPQRLHLGSHRRVPDVVCLAQVGWTITDGRPFPRGQHGYDPTEPDMWALFIAIGPGIAPRKLELVDNIDLYLLLCRLLGVLPETNDASNALADALVR